GGDRARVAGDDEGAGVLVIEAQVVAGHLDRSRRHQVGDRAGAEREAALVGGEAFAAAVGTADMANLHQGRLSGLASLWTTSAVYSLRSWRRRWTRASSGHQQA